MADQSQKSGDSSFSIQAKTISITTGITYSEAKEIALDVFKTNFIQLKGEALQLVDARAEELLTSYLEKLQNEKPGAIGAMADPDVQYAIFESQKAYARSGKKELGDLLVDILVERTKRNDEELKKIVLNECIEAAPKLTESQINVLTLRFLICHTQKNDIATISDFHNYFVDYVKPFCNKLTRHISDYQHLNYTGCASISMGSNDLHGILSKTYQGLLTKGFDQKELDSQTLSEDQKKKLIIPCLRDPSKFQLNTRAEEEFTEKAKEAGLTDGQRDTLLSFNRRVLSTGELDTELIKADPIMQDFISCWRKSQFKSMDLTSVGIAIAVANVKKTIGESIDLSIWIK